MYYNIVLGALLHDIGKFYQKCGKTSGDIVGVSLKGKHPLVSASFIEKHSKELLNAGFNVELVKEIAQRHHESSQSFESDCLVQYATPEYKWVCKLVSEADNISSSERLMKGQVENSGNYATRALSSVFSSISPDEKLYGQQVGLYKDKAKCVSETHTKNNTSENTELITRFDAEFSNIKAKDKSDYINQVNKLLAKYTWCFPSSALEIYADVSLYDHLKTTAAIAAIKYLVGDKKGQLFSILTFQLHKPEQYIIENKHFKNNKLTASYISDNSKRLQERFNQVLQRVLRFNKCGELLDCNILFKETYSVTLLIPSEFTDKVISLLASESKRIANQTDLVTYIEAAYKNMGANEIKTSNITINDVRASLENGYSVNNTQYLGIDNLLFSKGKWASSDNLVIEDCELLASSSSNMSLGDKDTYALVNIVIPNLKDILARMFEIDESRIKKWSKDSSSDEVSEYKLNYSTISRVSTVYRQLDQLLSMDTWMDAAILERGSCNISFITRLSTFFVQFSNYLSILNSASIGTIKPQVSIITLHDNDDILKTYERCTNFMASDTPDSCSIIYNGVAITESSLLKLDKLMKQIIESSKLNNSVLYKISGFINEYNQHLVDKSRVPRCIPLYFYKRPQWGSKDIQRDLCTYMDGQFNKLKALKAPDTEFLVLDHLITDVVVKKSKEDN